MAERKKYKRFLSRKKSTYIFLCHPPTLHPYTLQFYTVEFLYFFAPLLLKGYKIWDAKNVPV